MSEQYSPNKPRSHSEKRTKTVVDTVMITPESLEKWTTPPFQRPVKENEKVHALAESLKHDGGVLPGIITLGILEGITYIIDGQHRKAAFLLSGLKEGYTDVRTHYLETMAQMGEEFVKLNSQLVRLKPDDILRGLEGSHPPLAYLRTQCPFVGYDMIRKGSNNAPVVSMGTLLRVWKGSEGDIPSVTGGYAMRAQHLAESLTQEDANKLITFINLAMEAWGRDSEYNRLWGGLNLILCAWLYRNTVLSQYSQKTPKLTKEVFKKCLMSVSASADYVDWLLGRVMNERDRSPGYQRLKSIFAKRLFAETGGKVYLPQPAWAHSGHAHYLESKEK